MIYILKTLESMPHWYNPFCTELYDQLAPGKGIHSNMGYDLRTLRMMKKSDYLLVTYYRDLERREIIDCAAKVLFYHQGSGACPYMEFIDREAEERQLENVDIHLFSLPTFEKLVKEKYQLQNTYTIGFPLDLTRYEKYKSVPKKKKIVVSGHISPGKNFYLATYLLKDLMPEYEVWFSVIEREGGASGKWSDKYHLQAFKDMGYQFVFNHKTQEDFYQFLSDASHVFTCSLADTIALPIVEGALCGCIPTVPDIKDYWGQYTDYIDYGYDAFQKKSVEFRIKTMTSDFCRPKVDTKWFDSKLVVERLLEVLC